jgi:hypothetical protein
MEETSRKPKNPIYRYGQDDLLYYLVFFSTFEELTLPIKGLIMPLMDDAGVIKLYEPPPTRCLYVLWPSTCYGREHGG